jgi:CubicO group peptidase (beta-lactamase class C family)
MARPVPMTPLPDISGLCPPRFAAVKDAFAANFTEAPEGLNEQAARFSVCVGGETVVDLWAGWADAAKTRPFDDRTLTPVFSTGKAVMALLISTCVERGLLDYERAVAEYWPAFGQAGKDRVTVGQLMSHQAGLPGFDTPVDPAIWFDRAAALARLCEQAPMWPPGSASGYHPITIGLLAGELFRIVDGRSMGAALRQDFADPFGLDLWIGLPEAEHGRVAQMKKPTAAPRLGVIDAVKRAAFLDTGSAPGGRGSAEWRTMELPSANLHGTARDLARIMGVLADGGTLEGRTVLSPGVRAEMLRERIHGRDKVVPFDISWAAGLMRNEGLHIFGPNPTAAGHCGWGGSCAFADPDARVSGAYVMTRQSPHLIGDPRAVRLIEALYASL